MNALFEPMFLSQGKLVSSPSSSAIALTSPRSIPCKRILSSYLSTQPGGLYGRVAFALPPTGPICRFPSPVGQSKGVMNAEAGGDYGEVVTEAASTNGASDGNPFPVLPCWTQALLRELAGTVHDELGPELHSSRTPSDVKYFKTEDGNAEGSVVLRAGKEGSKIDFTLESWLHATLPFGTLDSGTIVVMLGTETDHPHFLFEFMHSGPALLVVLDHLPRKDLVLDSTYLKRFYEDTELDRIRQTFEKAPNCKPYIPPTLFIRSVMSPTASIFSLTDNSTGEGGSLDEQIATVVYPAATQVLQVWLEGFRTRGLPVENQNAMLKRDNEIKEKGVENDLSANMPRIFGEEIASRVVKAFRSSR